MGTVITAAELGQTAKAVIPGAATTTTGATPPMDMTSFFEGLNKLITTGANIVEQFQKMQAARNGGEKSNLLTSEKPQNTETVYHEKVIEKTKPHDKEKIKLLLGHLLREKALQLPPDILEMKLKDITGENFDKINYDYVREDLNMKMTFKPEMIIDMLGGALTAELDRMQETS